MRYAVTRAISAACILPTTPPSAARASPGGPSRAPGPRSRERSPRGPILRAEPDAPGSSRAPAASGGCAGSPGERASSPPRARAAPGRRLGPGPGRGPRSSGRGNGPEPRIPAGSRASCGAAGRARTIGRDPASAAHEARRVRPLARRAAMIRRPARVRILARNPRRRFARRTLGWKVLFIWIWSGLRREPGAAQGPRSIPTGTGKCQRPALSEAM